MTAEAAPRRPAIVLLAAIADNGVIGRDNALPFRQSSDLKRFKALSLGKPVVMGRKTYESIGRPLPGRTNIVITGNPLFRAEGVIVAHTLEDALDAAREDARARGADDIMVIGGSGVFDQCLPLADRMEITHVHSRPEGDVHFPAIDPAQWEALNTSDHPAGPQDEASYSFATYVRRSPRII